MATRVLFGLLALMTLGGAAAAGIGMRRSLALTGDWIGYGIPTEVAATIGIGLLAFGFGAVLLTAAAVAALGDRLGLWRILDTPVLDDAHPAARVGRGILRARQIWDTFVFLVLLAAVAIAALHDRLVASILAVTAVAVAALYLFLRGRDGAEIPPR